MPMPVTHGRVKRLVEKTCFAVCHAASQQVSKPRMNSTVSLNQQDSPTTGGQMMTTTAATDTVKDQQRLQLQSPQDAKVTKSTSADDHTRNVDLLLAELIYLRQSETINISLTLLIVGATAKYRHVVVQRRIRYSGMDTLFIAVPCGTSYRAIAVYDVRACSLVAGTQGLLKAVFDLKSRGPKKITGA